VTFFPDKEPQTDGQLKMWANMLFDAVREHFPIMITKSKPQVIKGWYRSFAALRTQRGPEEVDRVVNWYCQHMKEQYVPKAYSGMVFKSKFDRIKSAMETGESEDEVVPIEAVRISRSLLNDYDFPAEIRSMLPIIVARTMSRWLVFCEKMRQFQGPERSRVFLLRILKFYAPEFAKGWCIHLHRKYGRLESFTGPVLTLAWKPEHPDFLDSFWRLWSGQWTCQNHAFDLLLEELLKE